LSSTPGKTDFPPEARQAARRRRLKRAIGPAKFFQANPSQTQQIQANPSKKTLGFVWICLESFVRIWTF
jgi:hypothetical protein